MKDDLAGVFIVIGISCIWAALCYLMCDFLFGIGMMSHIMTAVGATIIGATFLPE